MTLSAKGLNGMSSPCVKLHESDLLITGIIRRTTNPCKHKTKGIIENINRHTFYIKLNNEIVSHETRTFLKLHSIQLTPAKRLHHIDQSYWFNDGMTSENITQTLVSYCDSVLPVNILTNSREMSSILSFIIKNNITKSTFVTIPKEAMVNNKYKPKVKVWCLQKKAVTMSMNDMVRYYQHYPNNFTRPSISVTKQHPYLLSYLKKEEEEEEQEEEEQEEEEEEKEQEQEEMEKEKEKEMTMVVDEKKSVGETQTRVTTYSFVGDNLYNVYDYLKLLSPDQLPDNFIASPVIHIDMAHITDNFQSKLLSLWRATH